PLESGLRGIDRDAQVPGHIADRQSAREHGGACPFEITLAVDAESGLRHAGGLVVLAARGVDLSRRPDEELTFFSLTVGVLGGVEGTLRRRHLPPHVSGDLPCGLL